MSFLAFATTIKADGEKDKFNPVSTAVNSLKIGLPLILAALQGMPAVWEILAQQPTPT